MNYYWFVKRATGTAGQMGRARERERWLPKTSKEKLSEKMK